MAPELGGFVFRPADIKQYLDKGATFYNDIFSDFFIDHLVKGLQTEFTGGEKPITLETMDTFLHAHKLYLSR